MALLEYAVVLTGNQGRIWNTKPANPISTSLLTVLQHPPSPNLNSKKESYFTAVCFEAKADLLAVADDKGQLYLLNIKGNRFNRIEKAGHACTAISFVSHNSRHLFAAYSDTTIRAYDTSKNVTIGVLREHKSAVKFLSVRSATQELLSTSSDCVVLWDIKKLQRKRCLGQGPNNILQASFSTDENTIIANTKDGIFHVWCARTFAHKTSFTLPVAPALRPFQHIFAISSEGGTLVAAGPTPILLVYDLRSCLFQYAISVSTNSAYVGICNICFLPDETTVAVLCTDGSVRLVDVVNCQCECAIAHTPPDMPACSMSLDATPRQLALISDGKVLLHDVKALRSMGGDGQAVRRILQSHLEAAIEQIGPLGLPTSPRSKARKTAQTPHSPAAMTSLADLTNASPLEARRGAASKSQQQQQPQPLGKERHSTPASLPASLDKVKLQGMLEAYGEYPAKYRLMVWEFLLQLPRNTSSFQLLLAQGPHQRSQTIAESLPLQNKSLTRRMAAIMSQLTHWCSALGELAYLPNLVFPFVKMGPTSARPSEVLFEMVATLILNHCQGWFSELPHPPLRLLAKFQAILAFHDPQLASHFERLSDGFVTVMWPMLSTIMTDALPGNDWMKLMDHIFTFESPDLLHYAVLAYVILLKPKVLQQSTSQQVLSLLSSCEPVDVDKVIAKMYQLRQQTPEMLRPVFLPFCPLERGLEYRELSGISASGVALLANEREAMREAEEALIRRRKVVSELEMRTKAAASQALSVATERRHLAQLEAARRAELRKLEAAASVEMARLDDRLREERLRQISVAEVAYEASVLELQDAWKRELAAAQEEAQQKQELMHFQLQSKKDDARLKVLEFEAQQRLMEMEKDAASAAIQSRVRDELAARQAALESKQRRKVAEMEADDEARAVKMNMSNLKRAQMLSVSEAAAANAATSRLMVYKEAAVEEEIAKLESERHLRHIKEDEALAMADATIRDQSRASTRMLAAEQILKLQAQEDMEWYENEKLRREQALDREKKELEAAERREREMLAELEQKTKVAEAQAALMERRRLLQHRTMLEDAEASHLMSLLITSRAGEETVKEEVRQQEEELQARLKFLEQSSQVQQTVSEQEVARFSELRKELREQQVQELREMERRHIEVMAELESERKRKLAALEAILREDMQSSEVEMLARGHTDFEAFKGRLHREFAAKEQESAAAIASLRLPAHYPHSPPARPPQRRDPSMAPISPTGGYSSRSSSQHSQGLDYGTQHRPLEREVDVRQELEPEQLAYQPTLPAARLLAAARAGIEPEQPTNSGSQDTPGQSSFGAQTEIEHEQTAYDQLPLSSSYARVASWQAESGDQGVEIGRLTARNPSEDGVTRGAMQQSVSAAYEQAQIDGFEPGVSISTTISLREDQMAAESRSIQAAQNLLNLMPAPWGRMSNQSNQGPEFHIASRLGTTSTSASMYPHQEEMDPLPSDSDELDAKLLKVLREGFGDKIPSLQPTLITRTLEAVAASTSSPLPQQLLPTWGATLSSQPELGSQIPEYPRHLMGAMGATLNLYAEPGTPKMEHTGNALGATPNLSPESDSPHFQYLRNSWATAPSLPAGDQSPALEYQEPPLGATPDLPAEPHSQAVGNPEYLLSATPDLSAEPHSPDFEYRGYALGATPDLPAEPHSQAVGNQEYLLSATPDLSPEPHSPDFEYRGYALGATPDLSAELHFPHPQYPGDPLANSTLPDESPSPGLEYPGYQVGATPGMSSEARFTGAGYPVYPMDAAVELGEERLEGSAGPGVDEQEVHLGQPTWVDSRRQAGLAAYLDDVSNNQFDGSGASSISLSPTKARQASEPNAMPFGNALRYSQESDGDLEEVIKRVTAMLEHNSRISAVGGDGASDLSRLDLDAPLYADLDIELLAQLPDWSSTASASTFNGGHL